jgi:hypothetical protein
METERIALSQQERDRLRVLHQVQQKQVTQIVAAQRLKVHDQNLSSHVPGGLFPDSFRFADKPARAPAGIARQTTARD